MSGCAPLPALLCQGARQRIHAAGLRKGEQRHKGGGRFAPFTPPCFLHGRAAAASGACATLLTPLDASLMQRWVGPMSWVGPINPKNRWAYVGTLRQCMLQHLILHIGTDAAGRMPWYKQCWPAGLAGRSGGPAGYKRDRQQNRMALGGAWQEQEGGERGTGASGEGTRLLISPRVADACPLAAPPLFHQQSVPARSGDEEGGSGRAVADACAQGVGLQ